MNEITLGWVELAVICAWWCAVGTAIGRVLERRRIARSVWEDVD